MVSEKLAPLRRRWPRLRRAHRLDERSRVAGGECVEEMLVHLKVEHHLHALTSRAEVFHVGTWKHVRFGQNDCFSFSPGQKLAEGTQYIVLLFRFGHVRALLRNDKWNGVHAEAGDSKLQPEAHDLENLSLDFKI